VFQKNNNQGTKEKMTTQDNKKHRYLNLGFLRYYKTLGSLNVSKIITTQGTKEKNITQATKGHSDLHLGFLKCFKKITIKAPKIK